MTNHLVFDVKTATAADHAAPILSSATPAQVTEIVFREGQPETFRVEVYQEFGNFDIYLQEYFDDHWHLGTIQGQDWDGELNEAIIAESMIPSDCFPKAVYTGTIDTAEVDVTDAPF